MVLLLFHPLLCNNPSLDSFKQYGWNLDYQFSFAEDWRFGMILKRGFVKEMGQRPSICIRKLLSFVKVRFQSQTFTQLKVLWTHHGKLGHIVGKCYKLHVFPPGFKFKGKNSMAHQVSFSHDYYQS